MFMINSDTNPHTMKVLSPPLDAICTPYKHPDIACVIPSPLRSTADAHVALQQLSHHVPYQVLPPNGGERK